MPRSYVLNDLAAFLPESPERDPKEFLKSLEVWREVVELTTDSTTLLARRLLGLGKAAESVYGSDAGTLAHLVEASSCLRQAAEIKTSPSLLAEILFIHARVLANRTDHPHFSECLPVGFAAFLVVKRDPSLLNIPLCSSGCSAHVNRLLQDVRENATKRDPRTNIQQLHEAIEILEFLISSGNEEKHVSSSLNLLGSAYELVFRMQIRLGEPLNKCTSTLRTALHTAESALKVEGRRFQTRICHALIASIYDEMSRLPDQDSTSQSKYNNLAIEHYGLAINHIENYIKLTSALEKRYKLHGWRQDLDECVSRLILQNKGHNTAKHGFYMSSQLVRVCLENNVRDKLLPAYKQVFQALRRMSGLNNTSISRYRALSNASASYACDAAAAALTNNDPVAAVELLEQGRGCFFAEQLAVQTDVNYVKSLDPLLGDVIEAKLAKIQQFTQDTDTHTDDVASPGHFEELYQERMQFDETPSNIRLSLAAHDLEDFLDRVRKLPGYQDPTEPKPFESLKKAADHCPIVYINVSQFRCDALILQGPLKPDVLVVPLPSSYPAISSLSLTMQKVVRAQGREVRDYRPDSTRHFIRSSSALTPEQQIQNVLKQLWSMIVRPVFVALGLIKSGGRLATNPSNLPHICWCPTGPAATFLPLHAAGDYSLGPEHRATSHVVSSYTSTVTSLVRTLERDANPHPSLLLIS